MWFKNVRAYRLTTPFEVTAEQLEQQLAEREFQHCSATQPVSAGWVPVLGGTTSALVHPANGRFLLRLRREERLLPSTVVREQLAEKVAEIEEAQGRKVYRKERLNLQDEIV
ncbi:MAG: recombination-associated protein RdgC, partial [Haliea sp.]